LNLRTSTPATIAIEAEYYDVRGLDPAAIRAHLNTSRAALWTAENTDATVHDARTRWDVRWTWTSELGNEGCTVVNVEIDVHIDYQMPRLISTSVPGATRRAWDHYVEALWEHEKGHGAFAIWVAEAVHKELSALPATPTCDALDAIAGKIAQGLLDGARNVEKAYDRDSGHGKAQGAVFP